MVHNYCVIFMAMTISVSGMEKLKPWLFQGLDVLHVTRNCYYVMDFGVCGHVTSCQRSYFNYITIVSRATM